MHVRKDSGLTALARCGYFCSQSSPEPGAKDCKASCVSLLSLACICCSLFFASKERSSLRSLHMPTWSFFRLLCKSLHVSAFGLTLACGGHLVQSSIVFGLKSFSRIAKIDAINRFLKNKSIPKEDRFS